MPDLKFSVCYWSACQWQKLNDTYATYNRAATIAAALENRGRKTQILETVDATHIRAGEE